MSEEMKNKNASVNAPGASDVASLNNAGESARARYEEDQKRLAEEERKRQEELEIRRKEDEAKNEAYLKKKQAEMEHAENYRQRLREDKERRRAMAAEKRAAKLKAEAKAEAERKKRAEEELARQNAVREHHEDAARRNVEKDTYLDKVSTKQKENEKFVEDYKNAKEEAEREYAKRLEEFNAKAQTKPTPAPAPAVSAPSDLSNVISIDFNETPNQEAKAPVTNTNDNITGATSKKPDTVTAPKADSNILTVNFDDIKPGVNPNANKASTPKTAPAPAGAPKAPKSLPFHLRRQKPMSATQAYVLGNSTFKLANKETDFGKDHADKKRRNEFRLKNFPIPPIKKNIDGKNYKYVSAVTSEPSGNAPAQSPSTKTGDKDDDSEKGKREEKTSHSLALAVLALDDKSFDRYASELDAYEELLLGDEKDLRRKQQKYHGDETIVLLKGCMDIEKELIESYKDTVDRAIISNNSKYYNKYSKRLSEMVEEYNADIECWNRLTNENVSKIPDAYVNSAIMGKPTEKIPTVTIPDDVMKSQPRSVENLEKQEDKAISTVLPATSGISARNPLVFSTRYPVLLFAEERTAINNAAAKILKKPSLDQSDVKKTFDLFKRSARFTEELTETENTLRVKLDQSYSSTKLVYLKECMALERQRIECYAQNYKCAVKADLPSEKAEYIEALSKDIEEYNADLLLWSRLTGTKPEMISTSFADNLIKNPNKAILIPVVALPIDVENAIRRRNALRKKEVFVPVSRTDDENAYEVILTKSILP